MASFGRRVVTRVIGTVLAIKVPRPMYSLLNFCLGTEAPIQEAEEGPRGLSAQQSKTLKQRVGTCA